ncbi:hypothetical protein BK025_02400 [Sodalis sp. TME1]|nr:hypothetical protein BK025_02400 [Sodalis sp. TME1]
MTQENDTMTLSLCEDGIRITFRGDMASYRKDGSIKFIMGIINNNCLPRRIILRDERNLERIEPRQSESKDCLPVSCE